MNDYAILFEQLLHEYDNNLKSIKFRHIKNKSGYDSIVISSEMTAYRPKVDNVLFARIKESNKLSYFGFRDSFAPLFESYDIPIHRVKSETGFFRVDVSELIPSHLMSNLSKEDLAEILYKVLVGTMNFATFGCCSKYQECSDKKKCVHCDPLYATACMYRKHLENNNIFYGINKNKKEQFNMSNSRSYKGYSIIDFPEDYCIIDTETTGLDTQCCDIIEIAVVKVRNSVIVDEYQSLINIDYELPEYITELTGITDDMLASAPYCTTVLKEFMDFIGNDILIGHNVHFDINFLYDNIEEVFGVHLTNNFVDTLRICKKLYPDENHHRLSDMTSLLSIPVDIAHRALDDCRTTFALLNLCKQEALLQYGSIDVFESSFKKKKYYQKIDIKTIVPTEEIDESHCLYGKVCVFTGELEKLSRSDAMQLVVNCGGAVKNNVTQTTNYLILGSNDFCSTIKDGKSTKQKKAEELKLRGFDIEIVSERTFYDMLQM